MLDIDEKILKFNPFYTRISEFNGYKNEITVKCIVCGETTTYKTAATIAYKTVKCPECERRMKEQKFIEHLKLYRPEIKVLGKYINRLTKILVQCMKCGNIYEAIPNNLYTIPKGERHGCVKCLNLKRTNEDFLKDMKIIQPNIEFLSPYNGYFEKILCKCKLCQFEFQASPDHLYRDTKCPNCLLKHRKRTELTYIEELKESNPYIELIPGTYINTKNDATFKCLECGYTWSTNAGHVLWDKTGCPICSKSKGEKEIAKILTNKNIKFIPLYELSVNFTNRRIIYVDFYLPDYNLFIEYNGEQHYIPVKAFGGELTLNDLKLRDEQLRTYCKVNDIYLLEIPYTEYKNKTIQKTIEDKLIEFINLKNY